MKIFLYFFQAFRTMLDGYSREQWKGTDRETTVMYEIAGNAYVISLSYYNTYGFATTCLFFLIFKVIF